MLHRIAVSPHGDLGLIVTVGDEGSPTTWDDISPEVVAAFNLSFASGIVKLAQGRWQAEVMSWPPEFTFWRDYARDTLLPCAANTHLVPKYGPQYRRPM